MKIETKRLVIEINSLEHLETTYEYFSDLEITKYTYYLPRSFNETKKFLEDAQIACKKNPQMDYEFAILYNDIHVGSISLNLFDNEKAEIGWILNKRYHHLGIATEAAFGIINYAKELNLKTLIAHCDTRNVLSYTLMEKIGMKRVGEGVRVYRDERGIAKEYLYELSLE